MAFSPDYVRRDFSPKTIKALADKGITFVGATWAPDAQGSFAAGETVYQLNDNGTSKLRTFSQVLAILA